jgi:hypothetical protein
MSTSILSAVPASPPRALAMYWLASPRTTMRFGARRSASATEVAPERRMSSAVITKMDAGASTSRSSRRETEVTLRFASCSSE